MSGKQHDFKIYFFKEFLNEVAVQIYCQAIIKTVVLLDQRRNSQSLTFFSVFMKQNTYKNYPWIPRSLGYGKSRKARRDKQLELTTVLYNVRLNTASS